MEMNTLIGLIQKATDFSDFQKSVFLHQENAELEALEKQQAVENENAKRAERFSDVDLNNLSPEMVVALGVTNGMPEWMVSQRFEAWKAAQTLD